MKFWVIVATSKMNGRKTVCTGKVWNNFWSENMSTQVFEEEYHANVACEELARNNKDRATYEVYGVEL